MSGCVFCFLVISMQTGETCVGGTWSSSSSLPGAPTSLSSSWMMGFHSGSSFTLIILSVPVDNLTSAPTLESGATFYHWYYRNPHGLWAYAFATSNPCLQTLLQSLQVLTSNLPGRPYFSICSFLPLERKPRLKLMCVTNVKAATSAWEFSLKATCQTLDAVGCKDVCQGTSHAYS